MNMKEPAVLKSKYVSMNEYGTYELDKDAPPNVVAAFAEYQEAITSTGFVDVEPFPEIPPFNE